MAMRGLCTSPALPGNAGLKAAVTGTGPLPTSALVGCCGVATKWGYGAWGHPGDKPALEGTAVQGVGWRVIWGPGDVRDTWWQRGWPDAAGPWGAGWGHCRGGDRPGWLAARWQPMARKAPGPPGGDSARSRWAMSQRDWGDALVTLVAPVARSGTASCHHRPKHPTAPCSQPDAGPTLRILSPVLPVSGWVSYPRNRCGARPHPIGAGSCLLSPASRNRDPPEDTHRGGSASLQPFPNPLGERRVPGRPPLGSPEIYFLPAPTQPGSKRCCLLRKAVTPSAAGMQIWALPPPPRSPLNENELRAGWKF